MALNKPGHVLVETAYYERAHGKAPRGEGQWGFCTVHPSREDYLQHVIWVTGKFGAAKRAAQAQAAGAHTVIYVCS